MKFAYLTILLSAIALATPQQDAKKSPEIRGFVVEADVNLPVAGAEIVLSTQDQGPVRINGGWKVDPARKIRTDDQGAFTVPLEKVGEYRVEAQKDGYQASDMSGPPNYAEVKLTADNPVASVKIFLMRPGRLTGTVVNEDTGKPIANLRLHAAVKLPAGSFFPRQSSAANTDTQGKFALTNLPPGEYAVEIGSQTEQNQRLLTGFTENDVKKVEVDYEHTYWPGGRSADSALPVMLPSNGSVDIGVLAVRKVSYYSVHVRIPASNCQDGDTLEISESIVEGQSNTIHSLSPAPCGKDLLITGYHPGTYRLMLATSGRTADARVSSSVPFTIVDRNIEISAALSRGVTVEATIVAAGGTREPDLTNVKLYLHSVDGLGYGDEQLSASPDPQGKFQFSNVRLVDQRLLMRGLAQGNFVQEIRYNGVRISGDTIPLDRGAPAHSVSIVVADNPGSISGTVMSGEQRIGSAYVIARKWPPKNAQAMSDYAIARSVDGGGFQLTGLAPGEYRIVALRNVTPGMGNALLERALADGQKIEIGGGETQSLTLQVKDLQ